MEHTLTWRCRSDALFVRSSSDYACRPTRELRKDSLGDAVEVPSQNAFVRVGGFDLALMNVSDTMAGMFVRRGAVSDRLIVDV